MSEEHRRPKPKPWCEVWDANNVACRKKATHCYPAMGGGWMSLCEEHATKHVAYTVTYDEAKRGTMPAISKLSKDPSNG